MIAGLEQPHSNKTTLPRSLHHRLHQRTAYLAVLERGIDRDRPNTGDRVALIQEIAADNSTVDLRHDIEKPLVTDQAL